MIRRETRFAKLPKRSVRRRRPRPSPRDLHEAFLAAALHLGRLRRGPGVASARRVLVDTGLAGPEVLEGVEVAIDSATGRKATLAAELADAVERDDVEVLRGLLRRGAVAEKIAAARALGVRGGAEARKVLECLVRLAPRKLHRAEATLGLEEIRKI